MTNHTHNKLIALSIAIAFSFLMSGCDKMRSLSDAVSDKIPFLSSDSANDVKPRLTSDDDTNRNGVRDDVEKIVGEILFNESLTPEILADVEKLFVIIKTMQPLSSGVAIDHLILLCQYNALSPAMKNKISLHNLQKLVIDSPQRAERFNENSINRGASIQQCS